MTSGEIAALVTAFGISIAAILTAVSALINARNSKDIVERLRTDILTLKAHNTDQDSLLIDREIELDRLKKENISLTTKIQQWQKWGETIGHEMNEMHLMLGYLTHRQEGRDRNDTTQPLAG